MALRFNDLYRVKAKDNLGSSQFWNTRLQDLDLRMNAMEAYTSSFGAAADQIIAAGISRIDDQLQPLVNSLVDQVNTLSDQAAALQDFVLTGQANLNDQLNALVAQAQALVDALNTTGDVDGGSF